MEHYYAVVGLGALFPGAKTVDQFWKNILSKTVSIRPLPDAMFDREIFYRPDLLTAINKLDKSVTQIAGWIEDLTFDTVRRHKIPPSVAEHMDSNQHAALYTAGQALQMNGLAAVPKDRVAVIYGNGMVGTRYGDAMFRMHFAQMAHELRQHRLFNRLPEAEREEIIADLTRSVLKETIPLTEDTAPGVLPNIIAARIASVYDFHGPSFTVDAACASVLAAVIAGMQGLALREYDAVICGGADMPLKQLGLVMFSALNALSPDGSFPFDKRANGFVMAQGAGTVILKRLEDAVAANDRILAVVTGWGEASDGKGKYIAAPNAEWQAVAIQKALTMAGYSPDTVEMVEAHGTATKVGDVVEVQGLKQAWSCLGATGRSYCGLTSVKSNIGHLKSAAGIAGLIKAVLALDNKLLPPTASFVEVNPKLELDDSPFYIIDQVRPWPARPEHPRRANVSSFGFGGADYHLALQEYRAKDYIRHAHATATLPAATSERERQWSERVEVVFFSGANHGEVISALRSLLATLAQSPSGDAFAEACLEQNYLADAAAPVRVALLASSAAELGAKVEFYEQNRDRVPGEVLRAKGVYIGTDAAINQEQIALLFPGQASQYPGMFQGLMDQFDTIRTWFRRADAYWTARHGERVTGYMHPQNATEEQALEKLRQTENAHPAIFVTSFALHDLLRQMGLEARYYIGHSLGEVVALAAAGCLSADDALRLVEARGYAFRNANLPDPGKMVSVADTRSTVLNLIAESTLPVWVANVNSTRQVIVAGRSPDVEAFKAFVEARKISAKLLFVSHAFHTPLLAPVAERFYDDIQGVHFRTTDRHVMMNHTGAPYATDRGSLATMPALLRDQLLAPVEFARSITALYDLGVRLFVEVGPGAVLSGLVKDTLPHGDVRILTANHKKNDDVTSLQRLLAGLFAEGVAVKPVASRPATRAPRLSEGVDVQYGGGARFEATTAPARTNPVLSRPPSPRVVYSGVAIGLPGSWKESFRDDNFDQLFAGRNLIERLSDSERQRLVDLQISKLIKEESGPVFKLLTTLDDVIQLAGKIGRIDAIRDYQIDEKIVQNMSSAIAHGVAAGYEALADARIPLVREYSATTTGKRLPGKLALPREMQDETGVIFANGFPLIDPVIREVSRYVAYQHGGKTRRELMAFYESIIERVKDSTARKLLTDWYALFYTRLTDNPGEEDLFRFNHHFITQISAQANNVLAYLLNARGPNFQMNAACSSTSNAISIAEDFIRTGRVRRMLVVGADDASSPLNFPLLGAGFLCTGAATNEADLYRAAIPFDRRRNGMIVGAGAVGIVLEAQAEAEARGLAPVAELIASHSFNTAKHVAQIDVETFSRELDRFLCRVEQEHGLQREEIARRGLYISHETYTPPRGGCSQTEAEALRRSFGESYRQIIVGNTKGMTGHTMGAALEDAVAARSLQDGRCPPVVNLGEPDPMLAGLNLWQGGTHDREYALKMSAGFGAQGHFALLRRAARGEQRIVDRGRYDVWLRRVTGEPHPVTERIGRLHVVHETTAPPILTSAEPEAQAAPLPPAPPVAPAPAPASPPLVFPPDVRDDVKAKLLADALRVFAEVTKYSVDMLDPDMEMEADLGIDTVKQATILAMLGEKYELERDATVQLSNYPTIRHLVDLIYERGAAVARTDPPPTAPERGSERTDAGGRVMQTLLAGPAAAQEGETTPLAAPHMSGHADAASPPAGAAPMDLIKLLSEMTGYPPEMLEPEMEFEADLGVMADKRALIGQRLGTALNLVGPVSISGEMTVGQLQTAVRASTVAGGRPVPTREDIVVWETELSRQTPVLVDAPLGDRLWDLSGRQVWVFGDTAMAVREAASLITARGAIAEGFAFADVGSSEDLRGRLTDFMAGRVADAIIDLTHAGAPLPAADMTAPDLERLLFLNGEARFTLYKLLGEQAWRPKMILCAISIDGAWGLEPGTQNLIDPWFGALAGFYKALRKEWPGVETRIVDFTPEIARQRGQLVSRVIEEIEHAGPGVEISYTAERRRMIRLENREGQTTQRLGLSANDTVLVSGGGAGVTARIVSALAEAYPVKLIIVDVVQIPPNAAELADLDEAGLARIRSDLQASLQSQHDRVTPAMINREYNAIMRGLEVYRNLQAWRNVGRQVEYIACDVRDKRQLASLLAAARSRSGPITAIVHGAGVDASHLLGHKSVEEFRRVFTIKVQGAVNLTDLCRDEPLRVVVGFGWIAGRFGNAAQLDYAAANDFLSHWSRALRRARPGLHAVTLVWSGWKDVGIAWRNDFVRQNAETSGLNFIDVEQGVAACLAEMTEPGEDAEIVLHKGLGGFLERDTVDHYLPDYPLIDRIIRAGSRVARTYRQFSIQRDALLDQHRLGKTPILPAVGYAELIAEYFALQTGQHTGLVLRDLRFPAAFKLFREAPRELYVEGEPAATGWMVRVKSSFRPPRATEAQTVLHASSLISSGLPDLASLDPTTWPFLQDEATSLPAERSLMLIQEEGPEQRIILGPLYNDVLRDATGKAPVSIYPRGSMYPTYFPLAQLNNSRYPLDRFLVNPCLLDSILQACAANLLVVRKRVYLPWHIEELDVVDPPRHEGLYRTYAQVVAESDEVVSFDIAMVDADGRLRYAAHNAAFRLINL